MSAWSELLDSVLSHLTELRVAGCPDPFFRGQCDSTWSLVPGGARCRLGLEAESRLAAGFQSMGGHLFPPLKTSWDVLFLMQHHGMPTRLLDWTEAFAVALYFALKNCRTEAAVWVLNPYEMNKLSFSSETVEDLNSAFPDGYEPYFTEDRSAVYGKFPVQALAVYSTRLSSRMQWQRAVFTFHRDLTAPLETLYPTAVRKFVIPSDALPGAKDFLVLSGMNEYSIFPDLDGLARYLRETEIDSAT